jgi:hypothetical protein
MPDLYIANTTIQKRIVCYRLDYNAKGTKITEPQPHLQRDIEPGKQICISGLHIDQAESIREQLAVYGLIAVSEIKSVRGVVPCIFNVDRAVKKSDIEQVLAHNSTTLLLRGKVRRQKAAVSVHDMLNDTLMKGLAAEQLPVPDQRNDIDIEIEQLEQSEAGESRIEEGIKVSDLAAQNARVADVSAKPRRGRPPRPRA